MTQLLLFDKAAAKPDYKKMEKLKADKKILQEAVAYYAEGSRSKYRKKENDNGGKAKKVIKKTKRK